MDIRVLGPLTVTHRDRDATPSARKPRQALSLLLLNEGEVVSTKSLISEIWDLRPPKSVQTTLQTYVMQIRKLLSTALRIPVDGISKSVLVTRNGGYMLMLRGADVDLYKYRSLERAGMSAFEARNYGNAVHVFDEALALWRGRALADVELGCMLEPAVVGLEQSRLTIVEYRLEAELRRGRHRESLSELASLAAQYGYNENIHALYMLALYRSGCRGKALEVYRHLRESMIDELGLDPSPQLQRLHSALLAGAPALYESGTGWQSMAIGEHPDSRVALTLSGKYRIRASSACLRLWAGVRQRRAFRLETGGPGEQQTGTRLARPRPFLGSEGTGPLADGNDVDGGFVAG